MDNRYLTLEYNRKARWLSYWYQLHETLSVNPHSLLVIGKGSGIVENTIAAISPQTGITTFDINFKLVPDIIGDLRHLPFKDSSFDCILCCQVLEHIPFRDLNETLNEFHRVVRDTAVISVPHARKYLKIEVEASLLGTKRVILKYPLCRNNIRSKHHCWEINRGVSYKELLQQLKGFFTVEKTFLNEIGCYHRFFVLKKRTSTLS